jgi:hypothetical protein
VTGLIRSAGDAARGYRACLLEDGTWASFSHDQSETTFAAAAAGRLGDVGHSRPYASSVGQ